MAKIQELLDNLLHKKLGRDVRQSIHDSIEQCYKDATGHPESVAGVIEENKNLKQAMAKQDARINNLAKLPGGSTAGDAELADIRVGADGETYDTAGQAVREQIGSLKSDTSRIKKNLRTTYVDMNLFALGTINKDTGEEESSNKILRSIIDVNATEDITIKLPKGYQWNVAHWLAGKYRSDLWNENGWYQNLTIEKTTMNYKYRILIRRSDGADITLSELIGVAETNREDLQSFDKIDDLKKKLGGKVDKEDGKGLSSNDYTNSDKEKLDNLNNYDDTDVKEQIGSLKESLGNVEERDIEPLNKSVFGSRKLLLATPIDTDWSGYMNEKGEIKSKDKSDRWHKTYKLCSEDTTIKVKDYAGGTIKHCIFLDKSNNVISTTTGGWTQQMLDVSVPSGARYVVVNATDSADMIICYTRIFDTDYNVAEKMNDVTMRINSAEATIGNVKESLNSVTDTVFSEKKYASLKSVEETKKVNNTGKFEKNGRANGYIVNTYIGQTLKARGYCGGIIPLIVFFDSDDKFVSYIDSNMSWNDNVYQDVVVPEGAYKAYVNDNDGDRTIDLQGLQFEKYNVKAELERLEGLIPSTSSIDYDLKQAQLQLAKTQRSNDFAYSKFDKAYFVLTIDDANKYLPDVYDLCHELGVPLCPAIIVGNLNTDYKNDGRTIKDICDLVVADGGEILAHSGKYITADSTEEDYADVFREPKIELEKLGYDIRGIITAGGAGYLSNDIKLDNWSRKYYDYSDQNGISSSKAYYRPRWWHHDYTMDGAKKYVDNAISNKSFVVMAMHGSDNADDLEHIDHVRELLQYIISKGTDKIVFTTWADVYDKFGSTKLEERIKALEEKVSN